MMKLNAVSFQEGITALVAQEPVFCRIQQEFGPPPLWAREPGFPTLIKIILEQQVSLASAAAAFDKLLGVLNPLTAAGFMSLEDDTLKAAGFSRQKTTYGRHLSRAVLDGRLDLDGLENQPDDQVRAELMEIKGIGRWTADIYLLMALLRPDVWPLGDLALGKAVQFAYDGAAPQDDPHFKGLAERWKPWRGVAARFFWHFYISAGLQRK